MSGERELPADILLEQAAIGAILINESAYLKVADRIAPEDFVDPLHQRIVRAIHSAVAAGSVASPLTIGAALANDAGLNEVGGRAYLQSLARAAPPVPNVIEYARLLRSLAQRRALIRIGEEMVADAYESTEPVAVADDAAEKLHSATHGQEPGEGPVSVFDLAHRAVALAGEAHADPESVSLSTGLMTLDDGLGRLFRGDLTVLGAQTSQGKTALVMKFLRTAAFAGHGALMFSLEMSGTSVAMRYVAEESEVPSDRMRRGKVTDPELEKIARAPSAFFDVKHRFKIDSTPNLSVAQMRSRVHGMKRKCPELALVVVDHLQFIAPADYRSTIDEQARQITRDLCALAKDFNIAIVLISHLTKDNERRTSRRPMMADLYGSGGIAQNADAVWFLYRLIYYLEREPVEPSEGAAYDTWARQCEIEKGWAEIFSTKARMGKTSSVRVRFREDTTTFYDPPPKVTTGLTEQERLDLTGAKMR